MKLRLVNREKGTRCRVFTNDVESLISVWHVIGDDYQQVGLLKFIWCLVFPRSRKARIAAKGKANESE
jgi:hypothetical protein